MDPQSRGDLARARCRRGCIVHENNVGGSQGLAKDRLEALGEVLPLMGDDDNADTSVGEPSGGNLCRHRVSMSYCDSTSRLARMRPLKRIGGLRRRLSRGAREAYGTVRVSVARRAGARVRERAGVTVVTANWNTLPFLEVFVEAVQRRSPAGTRIVVVDNGSIDGSREYLRKRSDIDSVMLPVNIGHGRALDIGIARAGTKVVAILDIDAFPISDDWLRECEEALESGKMICGASIHRSYVHPCFLVARRQTMLNESPSLRARGRYPRPGRRRLGVFLDTGEALSQALLVRYGSRVFHFVPITSVDGPGHYGTVFGGVVYHNFHATTGNDIEAGLSRFLAAAKRFA